MSELKMKLRRVAPVLALGSLLLNGCSSAEPAAQCYPVTIEITDHTVTNATMRKLNELNFEPRDLKEFDETIYDAHGALIDGHEEYKFILPGDSYSICLTGKEVSFGEVLSVNED